MSTMLGTARRAVGLFRRYRASQVLRALLVRLLVDLHCVLHELLDQVLGCLIGLLLRLTNPVDGIRNLPSPHQIIRSCIDDVSHDATLSAISGPDVRAKFISRLLV